MVEFNDWKKLKKLGSDLVNDFANVFDIAFHKDEEELKIIFANPSIEKPDVVTRVRRLNALYHTRLSDRDMAQIVEYLVSEGAELEARIKTGKEDVVKDIALYGDKNLFVFATKYCSFVNPDEYPIYDSLVTKPLSYFYKQEPFNKKRLGFDSIRQECDYERYKNIVKEFRNQYCRLCGYKEIDKFLWLIGKNWYAKN